MVTTGLRGIGVAVLGFLTLWPTLYFLLMFLEPVYYSMNLDMPLLEVFFPPIPRLLVGTVLVNAVATIFYLAFILRSERTTAHRAILVALLLMAGILVMPILYIVYFLRPRSKL